MCTEKFLAAVAEYYVNASLTGAIDLSELCVVFPNKRAAIYFRSYFKQQVIKRAANQDTLVTFIPDITTIGAFNERFTLKQPTDQIELLFVLYKAYRKVLKNSGLEPMNFDKFAFWGNMILSDFDDIDKEMADAHSLFTNIERYNEIGSYFLTPEQLEVVRSIWGDEVAANMRSECGRFWKHINESVDNDSGEEEKPSAKFLKFWQILDPLYAEFNWLLQQGNLAYPGLISREIATIIKNEGLERISFSRVAFVGFNMVCTSQAKMMKSLKDRGAADFFWDVLPAEEKYAERAGHRIAALNRAFPMPEDFEYPGYQIGNCKVDVYAVPSNTLQAKATGNLLQRWKSKDFYKTVKPDNSVIVLPEPTLLSPVLNALPAENLGPVNITMGLSYRETPFASLLHDIVSMHMRCHEIHRQPHFFHEDIANVISHPSLRAIALPSCLAIKDHLEKYHQYNVPVDQLQDMVRRARLPRRVELPPEEILTHGKQELQQIYGADALLSIFSDVPDFCNVDQVKTYIDNVMQSLTNALNVVGNKLNSNAHEVKVLEAYKDAIDNVFDCIRTYRIDTLNQGSIFGMLDRLLAVSTLNMSGTPLSGLQIMGVLETRALDFENVIVLSMNERVYPRRNRQHSLIPQLLRRAYGLPTTADTEQEYSYYFFRLFSRAKRVICMYDSRTGGAGNGAMSRYLLQFKYLKAPLKIDYHVCQMFAKQVTDRVITVYKDDKVMAELQAFKSQGEDRLNLSATALKKYRSCKLAFYFEFVKRMREDDTPTAFMDAKTYGSVMHNVLQQMFVGQRKNPNVVVPVTINESTVWESKEAILRRVKAEINELYHQNKYEGRLDYLPAESAILAELMTDFIVQILNKEKDYVKANGAYQFVDAEESLIEQWQITPNHKVNFRLDIDRHDIVGSNLHRFVDYKTGNDDPHIKSITGLFSPNNTTANDACLQLLIYSAAYSDIKQISFDIRPSLYQLKTAFSAHGSFKDDALTLGTKRQEVIWTNSDADVPAWQSEFRDLFEEFVDSIFDPNVPFSQTCCLANCKYCKFLQMCARVVPDNF